MKKTNDYGVPKRIAGFKLSTKSTDLSGKYTRLDGDVEYSLDDPCRMTVSIVVKGHILIVKDFSRSYDDEWLPFFVEAVAWGCGVCYALSAIDTRSNR